jgi:ubiquinone/menaquinone biosynthesis C-methylase UbiE
LNLCPICGKYSTFEDFPRKNSYCSICNSVERHRLVWLFFKKKTNLFDGNLKMLHIAPERCFESALKKTLGKGYITADLCNPRAMIKMDVTDIQAPNNFFDVIYCNHVLEHVQNDKLAISEMARVLKVTGWAVINVPINKGLTYEDELIVDPKERFEKFGQTDHVRKYGEDYIKRLNSNGFQALEIKAKDFLTPLEIKKNAITKHAGSIFFCRKRLG